MVSEMKDLVVVDDNPVLVSVLSEIFKEGGYTVRAATDGFAVLETIRNRIPDILMSDLNMPRMSGFELLSIVRRRFPTIAVIAMSGAYSGVAIPQGVAADEFYAKGTSSVARLFEILHSIRDEASRHSKRAAVPIWISGMPLEENKLKIFVVACPECLRTFPYPLHDAKLSCAERCCPHCQHPVQLAIVGPLTDMDETCISSPAKPTVHRYATSPQTPFRVPSK
jgi:CheY-like chemotaxis protein